MTAPAPRGRGRSAKRGRGGVTGRALCGRDRGGGKSPPRQPLPNGDIPMVQRTGLCPCILNMSVEDRCSGRNDCLKDRSSRNPLDSRGGVEHRRCEVRTPMGIPVRDGMYAMGDGLKDIQRTPRNELPQPYTPECNPRPPRRPQKKGSIIRPFTTPGRVSSGSRRLLSCRSA
jgi:hypothetical protein